MPGDGAVTRLRRYLGELPPSARALLAAELERASIRGDEVAGSALILEELRRGMREPGGPAMPRASHPQRLFCAPLAPFLIDQGGRHLGRVARTSIDPLWQWLCREVAPAEAKSYVDEVNLLIAADGPAAAEQVARTFQDVVVERLRETLAAAKSDARAARNISTQIGVRDGAENLREVYAILRSRDALAVVASRLPPVIGNLNETQIDNVKALLDSPVGCHPDVFLHALIVVMGRLAAPWQLIRLAKRAANSEEAARVAQTPFAVAVDLVIAEIERAIGAMRAALEAGRRAEVVPLIKDIHDAARALHTELDLSGDLPWARKLGAARGEAAALLKLEIESIPDRVRRLLRPRHGADASKVLDAAEVAEAEAALDLFVACRAYAGELAFSEATRRVDSDLQNFCDSGTQILLDALRTAPSAERAGRQSQVDAAVRFCGKLFGGEYAALLSKAADVAAKEQKAAARGQISLV